jgi:hypothetical protein
VELRRDRMQVSARMKVDRLAGRFIKLGQHLGVAPDDLGECCGEGSNDPTRWSQEDRSSGVQSR